MELNIVYSCDDKYSRHLMVSLCSLYDHNRDFRNINVYIISNGISSAVKAEILRLSEDENITVSFIDYDKIADKIRTDGKFSLSAFGRLFLSDIIPASKLVYLDCDSVVNGSFHDLMELDISEHICAAVQDNVASYFKTVMGLQKTECYYNSGMILFNMEKWREEGMQEKALNVIEKFHGSVPHHDQGVLNAICRGKILRLHPKYNFQCPMFEYTPKQLQSMIPGYYTEKELQEAKSNPVFIHFTEGFSNRPWRIQSEHPYRHLYRKYQDMTSYAGQLEDVPLNKNAAIMYKAYRTLPFPMYRIFCDGTQMVSRTLRKLKR